MRAMGTQGSRLINGMKLSTKNYENVRRLKLFTRAFLES